MIQKLKVTLVSIIIGFLLLFQVKQVYTTSAQPPAGFTGAPSENTCGVAGGCHNTTPNTGPGNVAISFSGITGAYIPDTTYQLTVTVSQTGITKFGFEATAVDASGNKAGNFTVINTTNTSMPPGGVMGRQYVGHKFAGTNNVWTVNWTAPDRNIGPVTFYAAGNAANGNQLSTGDKIYISSLQIKGDFGTGVFDPKNPVTSILLQNPVANDITVKYDLSDNQYVAIQLFDLNGKLIREFWNGNEAKGIQYHSFPITGDVQQGLYLLQFTAGKMSHAEKVFIQ